MKKIYKEKKSSIKLIQKKNQLKKKCVYSYEINWDFSDMEILLCSLVLKFEQIIPGCGDPIAKVSRKCLTPVCYFKPTSQIIPPVNPSPVTPWKSLKVWNAMQLWLMLRRFSNFGNIVISMSTVWPFLIMLREVVGWCLASMLVLELLTRRWTFDTAIVEVIAMLLLSFIFKVYSLRASNDASLGLWWH